MGIKLVKGSYWVDYRDSSGRRIRKKVGTNKKFAEAVLRARLKEVDEERFLGIRHARIPRITFDEAVGKYLELAKGSKVSWVRDRQSLDHWLEVFSGRRLLDISRLDVERQRIKRKELVAPRTVNEEVACLRRLFNRMIEMGLAEHNPARCIKPLREPPGRIKTMSLEEERRLLEACPPHIRPLVLVALQTGMRLGEILRLEWDDVDFPRNVIIVRNSKNGQRREIVMTRIAREALKGMARKTGSVFLTPQGQPYRCQRGIWETFKRATLKAGFTDLHLHDLRHVFATNLRTAGADLADIKECLGHKTLVMTNRYAHITNKRKQDVMKLLDGHYLDTGDETVVPMPEEGHG